MVRPANSSVPFKLCAALACSIWANCNDINGSTKLLEPHKPNKRTLREWRKNITHDTIDIQYSLEQTQNLCNVLFLDL